jgi:hypothetical protein
MVRLYEKLHMAQEENLDLPFSLHGSVCLEETYCMSWEKGVPKVSAQTILSSSLVC